MKKLRQKIVAMICALTMVAGTVLVYDIGLDMQTVEASTSTATTRETLYLESYWYAEDILNGAVIEDAVPEETEPTEDDMYEGDIPEGYVFAGWYLMTTDGKYEAWDRNDKDDWSAYDNDGEYTFCYAKFVDENVLSTKAQILDGTVATDSKVNIRFVTTVDAKEYKKIGFDITINDITKTVTSSTVYNNLYYVGSNSGATMSYEPDDEFSTASIAFKTYTIRNVPNVAFANNMTVRAFWDTLDGTRVYGTQAVKNINKGIFKQDEIDDNMLFNCDNRDYLDLDYMTDNDISVVSDAESEYKEGKGAIEVTGSGQVILQTVLSDAVELSQTVDGAAQWKCWVYVEDASVLPEAPLYMSFGRAGNDSSECAHYLITANAAETLVTGWNELAVGIVNAAGGTLPSPWDINFFRIYFGAVPSEEYTIIVDSVRVVNSAGTETMVMDCDDVDGIAIADTGNTWSTTAGYQEGAAALEFKCAAQNGYNVLMIQRRKKWNDEKQVETDHGDGRLVDLSECDRLSFWAYVDDTSKLGSGTGFMVNLSSGNSENDIALQWGFTIKQGWNEYVCDFNNYDKAYTSYGPIDFTEMRFLRIMLQDDDGGLCNKDGLVVKIDGIRGIAAKTLFNCDTPEGAVNITSAGVVSPLTVTGGEYKQGRGALESTGSDLIWTRLVRETGVDISATEYQTGRLNFKLHINNTGYLSSNSVVVRMSSNADPSSYYREWYIAPSKLKAGWNTISLPVADPDGDTGAGLTSITSFQIHQEGSNTNLVTTIDDVYVGVNGPQLVDTTYETNDAVVADVIPQEMGYAVDPSGATDSTAGINAALADLSKNGGGTVYLPAGTYVISEPIHVPAYVTLRGDWNDPDADDFNGQYGTVISVQGGVAKYPETAQQYDLSVNPGEEGYACGIAKQGIINLGGSGGVVGLTVHYAGQSLSNILPYTYTFYVNGLRLSMMSTTIRNVTVINGYKGIGATVTDSYSGTYEASGHECLQIENFKGTFLHTGIEVYKSSDVGETKNVTISPKYWAQYDGNQSLAAIQSYTMANANGMDLGDVEWTNYTNVDIEYCNYGVLIQAARREASTEQQFAGAFYNLSIQNCNIGFQANAMDTRWGMVMMKASIGGVKQSIVNNSGGIIKLSRVVCNIDPVNWSSGSVNTTSNSTPSDANLGTILTEENYYTKPIDNFIVADLTIYNDGQTLECSEELQDYLDYMGRMGGGVVYVPGGLYRLENQITIPKGVELRGSSSVATRDIEARLCTEETDVEEGFSRYGTVFFSYYGEDLTCDVDTATTKGAFITLAGENAGLNGIRIWYPENGAANTSDSSKLMTTYTVQGSAPGVYVTNCTIAMSALGILFDENTDNACIDGVYLGCYYNAIRVRGDNTFITNTLQNATVMTRTVMPINRSEYVYPKEQDSKLFNPILKPSHRYIVVEGGAQSVTLINNFAFGVNQGIAQGEAYNTQIYGFGIDQCAGVYLAVTSGTLMGRNMMQCYDRAGTTYCATGASGTTTGAVYLYNALALNNGVGHAANTDNVEKTW